MEEKGIYRIPKSDKVQDIKEDTEDTHGQQRGNYHANNGAKKENDNLTKREFVCVVMLKFHSKCSN